MIESSDSDEGKVFSGFVEAELKAERERRNTLDARAGLLVTSSVGIATLLAGLVLALTTATKVQIPASARWLGTTALLLFAFAAIFGLVAALPRQIAITSEDYLRRLKTEFWDEGERDARRTVVEINIRTIESLRTGKQIETNRVLVVGRDFSWMSGSNFRAKLVVVGSGCQILAVILWACAVLSMLTR